MTEEDSFINFIEDNNISWRLFLCLVRNGYNTIEKILNCSEKDLMKLNRYGKKCHEELLTALTKNGLSLKKED